MKILIITDAWHPQVNGVVRTYEYMCAELEKMGHDIHIIGPTDFPRNMPMPGYDEIRMVLFPARRLKRLIEKCNPDHIHIATEGPLGWAARKYCIRHKKLFSTSYHTHFPDYAAKRAAKILPAFYNPVRKFCIDLIRKFHSPSSVIFTATPSLDEELRGWGIKNDFARLSRGVYLDRFYPAKTETDFAAYDHLHNNAGDNIPRPIALYVGRVAIEKNLEDFLAMEWEGSRIVIGDGPSMQSLSAKYPDAKFLGKQEGDALATYYRAADIFVFPSKTDTFGIVIIEALASGLPVAGYNVTGPKDIITHEFLGALTDKKLSKAAEHALASNARTDAREKRAAFVKTHYTWANTAEQFLNVVKNFTNS